MISKEIDVTDRKSVPDIMDVKELFLTVPVSFHQKVLTIQCRKMIGEKKKTLDIVYSFVSFICPLLVFVHVNLS